VARDPTLGVVSLRRLVSLGGGREHIRRGFIFEQESTDSPRASIPPISLRRKRFSSPSGRPADAQPNRSRQHRRKGNERELILLNPVFDETEQMERLVAEVVPKLS
jgi:hypothetical protein